jgi:hypothetical protein
VKRNRLRQRMTLPGEEEFMLAKLIVDLLGLLMVMALLYFMLAYAAGWVVLP